MKRFLLDGILNAKDCLHIPDEIWNSEFKLKGIDISQLEPLYVLLVNRELPEHNAPTLYSEYQDITQWVLEHCQIDMDD